jgi:hypothetical protein
MQVRWAGTALRSFAGKPRSHKEVACLRTGAQRPQFMHQAISAFATAATRGWHSGATRDPS